MAKFHISLKGEPAICKAAKGKCPRGGDEEHFASREATYEAIEVKFSEELGIFPTSPLTKADLASARPEFSGGDVDWSASFKLEETATPETKNKGEYSEFYATAHLLSTRPTHFNRGTTPFTVSALRVKDREYVVDRSGEEPLLVTRAAGAAKVVYIADPEIHLDAMHSDLTRKRVGAPTKTFSSASIQSTCVTFGFTDGRVPKEVSTSKADVVVWDQDGRERRISIKSFMGANPALINSSKQSELSYEAAIPATVDQAQIDEISLSSNHSTKEKIAAFKKLGIHFDATAGVPTSRDFQANLASVDPDAQKAYCAAAFQAADSTATVPRELEGAYQRTLHAFATRMTHGSMEPEENAVTDFLSVNANGSVTIANFPTAEETGSYFADRVRFQEPSKQKFTTGVFAVEEGKLKFTLNAFASLSPQKRA